MATTPNPDTCIKEGLHGMQTFSDNENREKDHAGLVCIAWKTAKSRKWGKNGKPNEKQPPAGQEQNMAKKRIFEGVFNFLALFWLFWGPVQLVTVFHLVFQLFPISGFWPFSLPSQPGMIRKTETESMAYKPRNKAYEPPLFAILHKLAKPFAIYRVESCKQSQTENCW